MEGNGDNKFIITQHTQFEKPINVPNIYGKQESRMNNEKIDRHWEEVMEIIANDEVRGKHILMVGDMI